MILFLVLELQDKYITFTIKQNSIQISVSQIPLEIMSKAAISSIALSLYFSFVLTNGHDLVYVIWKIVIFLSTVHSMPG